MATVNFTDYLKATTESRLTDLSRVRNAAIQQRFAWCYTTRGKKMEKLTGGGDPIKWDVELTAKDSFQTIGINDPQTATMPQLVVQAQCPWIEGVAEATWNDRELVMTGGSEYTEEYRHMQMFNLKTAIMNRLTVDFARGVEAEFWRVPSSLMVGLTASKPISLLAYLNDHMASSGATNGNFYNTTEAAAVSDVAGITNTSAARKRWKQRIRAYSHAVAAPAVNQMNVTNCMDALYHELNYSPPSSSLIGSSTNWEEDQWPGLVCFTSMKGITHVQDLTRQQGDRWTTSANPQTAVGGPLGGPMYGGMEYVYIPALDTVTAYLDSYTSPTAMVTEGDNSGAGRGPRYYIVNMRDAVSTTVHKDRAFVRKEPRQYDNQPSTNTIWGSTYFQFTNKARWMNAIIAPGAITGTWPDVTYAPSQVFTAY